jgi:phosphoglycerate dehydrogenase-like enzyme
MFRLRNSWGAGQQLNKRISLEPRQFPAYLEAIVEAGAQVVPLSEEVEALVWTDYARPDLLKQTLEANPQLRWVQLPFAGVDAFQDLLSLPVTFTSAKRSYSEPVAEHALMLSMALGRVIKRRVLAKSWGKKHADSLYDNKILIVGGGGIAQEMVRLLEPYRSEVVVVRKRPDQPFDHSPYSCCVGFEELEELLPKVQFVVLACALTAETRMLFDSSKFALMRNDAYLVNVARGEVVDQDALREALLKGEIAGAATDVTYPEPLPDGHPLWDIENLIITPHTADTMEIVTGLFVRRLKENVSAWLSGTELVGVVDPKLGY